MGRIGQAIARRLEAMAVPVVYHSRRPAAGVSYRHYPKLIDMVRLEALGEQNKPIPVESEACDASQDHA